MRGIFGMFERVVGQEQAKNTIGAMALSGNIPHALLFAGPYGVGKGETAFELARMLLCENGPGSGCTTCGSCRRASKLGHPDLHLLFPFRARPRSAEDQVSWLEEMSLHRTMLSTGVYVPISYEKNRQIVVELVDEIRERLMESSFEGGRRVCVVLNAERLNPATSNKLLKILEEPPSGVHFILTTELLSSVRPTITSRCSVIRFRRLRDEEIRWYLAADRELDPDRIVSYTRTARGSIKAAKALAYEDMAGMIERSVSMFETIATCDKDDAVAYALDFQRSRDPGEVEELIRGFTHCTKSILEHKLGITDGADFFPGTIRSLSVRGDIAGLGRLSAGLEEALEMLGRNVNAGTVMSLLCYGINDTFRHKHPESSR